MLAVFDDAATLRHALAFESALACAEAETGVIGEGIAARITAACASISIDSAELADEAALAGTLAIPLVARLRAELSGDPESARLVHHGATSQDVADTVLMCQVQAASRLLLVDLDRTLAALAVLAERYAGLPAIGRTLLQDAIPIGFGLRFAQWLLGLANAKARLVSETAAGVVLQFGGAAGTRAGLGGKGAEIAARMAEALGLGVSVAPWHARRGNIAGIAASLGIVIGALGKIARDVSLLAQNGVGEAREPAIPGRGGSSAMKHKRNPTGSQIALSAALRAPGLVAGILAGLPQEEERGLGGWQAEGPALVDLFLLASGAAAAIADIAEGLEIDEAAIARNLARTGQDAGEGADIGESRAMVDAILATYRSRF
ncbi:MAG TPA: lyase family protein [Acidiphilium sp.]